MSITFHCPYQSSEKCRSEVHVRMGGEAKGAREVRRGKEGDWSRGEVWSHGEGIRLGLGRHHGCDIAHCPF